MIELKTELNVKEICDKYRLIDYIINIDKSITLIGSVRSLPHNFPLIINEVTQNLSLRNMGHEKLPVCPETVGWNLLINQNNLTSLVGLPKTILGGLYMEYNKLEHSKENFEILRNTYVGDVIEGDEDFMLAYNRYNNIINIINS